MFRFSGVAADANKGTFSTNVISFLRTNQFDGLMLDWRFPETDEKDAFTALCQVCSDWHKQTLQSGKMNNVNMSVVSVESGVFKSLTYYRLYAAQQLSDDFDSDTTSGDSLLLGAAVSGDPVLMNDIYDIPALDK